MPKYRVLIDTIIEGHPVREGANLPSQQIPEISEEAADGYIAAGLLEKVDEDKERAEAEKRAAEADKVNSQGVIDASAYSRDELVDMAKKTPNCDFPPNGTKAEIANAINTVVATNAANAGRGNAA